MTTPLDIAAQAVANRWNATDIQAACEAANADQLIVLRLALDNLMRMAKLPDPVLAEAGHPFDVRLEYRSAKGAASERAVTIHRLIGTLAPDGMARLQAIAGYCHERKAPRTFLAASITRIADAITGEVPADMVTWLRGKMGGTHG